MIFNLAKLTSENVILTNEDDQFVGTDLELQPFIIEVKRLTRAETIDVASVAMNEDGTLSGGKYSEAIFVSSIVSVDGFTDENNNPIGMDDKVVNLIWEYAPDTLVNAIKEKIESFKMNDEKKSESLENDSLDIPNGS